MSRWEELYVEFLGNERDRRRNNSNCAEAQLYRKTAGACGKASANASSNFRFRALEVLTLDGWPANAEVESIESIGYPDDSGRAGVVATRLIRAVACMRTEPLTPYLRQHQGAQEVEGVVHTAYCVEEASSSALSILAIPGGPLGRHRQPIATS
jgi:hypothetical protein